MAHITQCILQQAPSNQNKKEQGRERSKSIRIKLTNKATKLFQFQRKSTVKSEADSQVDFYSDEFVGGGSVSDDLDLYSKTPSGERFNSTSI